MKPALFLICGALVGLFAGVRIGARPVAGLDARARKAERERDELSRTKVEMARWADHEPAAPPTVPTPVEPDGKHEPDKDAAFGIPGATIMTVGDMVRMSSDHAQKTLSDVSHLSRSYTSPCT